MLFLPLMNIGIKKAESFFIKVKWESDEDTVKYVKRRLFSSF